MAGEVRGRAVAGGRTGWSPAVRLARGVAVVCCAAFAGAAVLLIALPDYWLPDLLSFFTPLIGAGLVLWALAALLARRWVAAVLLVGLAAALLAPPLTSWRMARQEPAGAPSLRILSANLTYTNLNAAGFQSVVKALAPDVIVTQETTKAWLEHLKAFESHPFGSPASTDIAVRSARAIEIELLRHIGQGGARPLKVRLPMAGSGEVVIFVLHPRSPRSLALWRARNLYLAELAQEVRAAARQGPVIVAGDWNTSSWSYFFRAFCAEAGVAPVGTLWDPGTRVFRLPLLGPVISSPVDHFAVSPHVGVVRSSLGADFGSDHLPIYMDAVVAKN